MGLCPDWMVRTHIGYFHSRARRFGLELGYDGRFQHFPKLRIPTLVI